jgi:hypothetical protein
MSPDKPTPDKPTNPVPPVNDKVAPAEPSPEPPLEGVLTAEDIAEIKASGLTLGDLIRELELPPE